MKKRTFLNIALGITTEIFYALIIIAAAGIVCWAVYLAAYAKA